MSKALLLEIGTEEIPAAFLPKALKDMEALILTAFAENRISCGDVRTMGTPRRLLLSIASVAEKQEDRVAEKLGPALRAAFDAAGNPTPAALGFARGQGIPVSALERASTDKGEYVCARRTIVGEATETLLPSILAKLIAAIPFRKSMRWSDLDIRFARPIHWVLALCDGRVIPLRIGNIESGNLSRGHRFMSPATFPVDGLAGYLEATGRHYVIADPDERKRIIRAETASAAAGLGGTVLQDEALLETVAFLTEYPSVICGSFDPDYLKLPKEVLVTTMISHQKYFPVLDAQGALLPHFLAVSNTLARDPAIVRRGNEKVLRARLADARFFFEADRKTPLEARVPDLKKVVFHSLLGTSYEKVMRFRKLAGWIADRIRPAARSRVDRAALLAKADLDTQMVCEFAELQGIMGREYALLDGEDPVVARAVYEHYLPTGADSGLPETDEGAIVSIADKLDTICGFFGVGLSPTGTTDPYALRRQALGIINIILRRSYPLSLGSLVDESLAILGPLLKRSPDETKEAVLAFFRGRLENQFIAQGRRYDVVDAVLAKGIENLVQIEEKIRAMEAFKSHPDFRPLAAAFKRVVNIIGGFRDGAVNPDAFTHEEERHLHAALQEIRTSVLAHIAGGDYGSALVEMARLRKPVDAFFEAVLVMAEEEGIRFNRLSLLWEISTLFHDVADFAKIVTDETV